MLQGQILHGQMSLWQLEYVHKGTGNLHFKFGQNWTSNSWDIADILLIWTNVARTNVAWTNFHTFFFWWQLEYVHKGPRNLHLKFGQNRTSNSWDIADILLIWTNVTRTNVAWTNVHLTMVLDCSQWMCNNKHLINIWDKIQIYKS